MVQMVQAASAVPAAMEHRSQPGSLAFPLIWALIPSAAAVVAALAATVLAPEVLAELAAAVPAVITKALQARMVLVAAVVAVAVSIHLAEPAEPAAWRFNMPTTAMWQLET